MAQIHNSDLIKGMSKNAGIQTSFENPPNQLAEKVVPVMEVNPAMLRNCNIIKNLSGSATSQTIYTTPADRDFYLVAASLSVIKDATATSTGSSLRLIVDGASVRILDLPGITLTAQNQSVTINFTYPIKVDRNTAITLNHLTNVANILGTACIIGYVVDNSNA